MSFVLALFAGFVAFRKILLFSVSVWYRKTNKVLLFCNIWLVLIHTEYMTTTAPQKDKRVPQAPAKIQTFKWMSITIHTRTHACIHTHIHFTYIYTKIKCSHYSCQLKIPKRKRKKNKQQYKKTKKKSFNAGHIQILTRNRCTFATFNRKTSQRKNKYTDNHTSYIKLTNVQGVCL